MNHVAALWRGEIPLAKTGWLYGLAGILILIVPLIALSNAGPVPAGKIVMLALSVTILLYAAFIAVAVWRSAGKYQGALAWRLFAKGSVLFVGLQVVAGLGIS